MAKAERLMWIMNYAARTPAFTVQQLADELSVSRRTALRYLHALSELGIPLAAKPGPHGGYELIRNRVLPPVSFSVDEAVALFFAFEALAGYADLPFSTEVQSALGRLYEKLAPAAQGRVDGLKDRFRLGVWDKPAPAPHRAERAAACAGSESHL